MIIKILILEACILVLLLNFTFASESISPNNKQRQKYRIVKIYGRRLKPNSTTTVSPPTTVESPNNDEIFLPRDPLHSSPHQNLQKTSNNVIKLGEMDLKNFDVGKLVAAAQNNPNFENDPSPTVVQFTAPSSSSHLDPAYLSKLITEQLGMGQSSEVKNEHKNKEMNEVMKSKLNYASLKSYRNSDDEVNRNKYSYDLELPKHTTTSSPVYEKNNKDNFSWTTSTSTTTGPKYISSLGSRIYKYTTEKPAEAQTHGLKSNKQWPYQPKVNDESKIKHESNNGPISGGYSTLGQQMTAPDIAPAILGQYASYNDESYKEKESSDVKNNKNTTPNPYTHSNKYTQSFVRGFVDDVGFSNEPKSEYFIKKPSLTYTLPSKEHYGDETKYVELPSSSSYDIIRPNRNNEKNKYGANSHVDYQPSSIVFEEEYSKWSPNDEQNSQKYNFDEIYQTEAPTPPPVPALSYQVPVTHTQKINHPIVSKTIYVNLPPEERKKPKFTTPKPPVLPQRHYKIVFIKAPTPPPEEEPEIEVTPAPETKTIIYVLHKKPEERAKIKIKSPPPTPPSKPEVYYIQYKDKENQKKGGYNDKEEAVGGYSYKDEDNSGGYGDYSNNNNSDDWGDNSSSDYSSSPDENYFKQDEIERPDYHHSSSSSIVNVSVKKTVSEKNK